MTKDRREYFKAYNAAHREHKKAYYEANKRKIIEYIRQWQDRNWGRLNLYKSTKKTKALTQKLLKDNPDWRPANNPSFQPFLDTITHNTAQ